MQKLDYHPYLREPDHLSLRLITAIAHYFEIAGEWEEISGRFRRYIKAGEPVPDFMVVCHVTHVDGSTCQSVRRILAEPGTKPLFKSITVK